VQEGVQSGVKLERHAESLLHMADEALYRAKQMGRHRVELVVTPEHAAVRSSDSPVADRTIEAESH
jgi:hypothetical protein